MTATVVSCTKADQPGTAPNPGPIAEICGEAPWVGNPPSEALPKIYYDATVCSYEQSRVLRDANSSNRELAEAVAGGCWNKQMTSAQVLNSGFTHEDVRELREATEKEALWRVIQARAGHCSLRRPRPQ